MFDSDLDKRLVFFSNFSTAPHTISDNLTLSKYKFNYKNAEEE